MVLCQANAGGNCPPGPPTRHAPIVSLDVVISSAANACCPTGYSRVMAAVTDSGAAGKTWNGDFNDQAGGNFVYLCYQQTPPRGTYSSNHGGGEGLLATQQQSISELVAFVTPSDADPFEDCPSGFTKWGNYTNGNLNSGNKNLGYLYLCYKRVGDPGASTRPLTSLMAVVGNTSSCPLPSTAVHGTQTAPRNFDFDSAGIGLRLCYTT